MSSLGNPCLGRSADSSNFFAHPENDAKYIQCSQFGQMFVFSCPEGLRWNQEATSCEKRFRFVDQQAVSRVISKPKTPVAPVTPAPLPAPVPQLPPVQQVPQQVPQQVQQQQQQPMTPFTNQVDNTFQTFVPSPPALPTAQQPQQPQQPQQQQQQQQQPQMPTQTTSASATTKCTTISIRNSLVPIVNGVYGQQIGPNMFRRSDDIKLPGLIAAIGSKWCVSFSFTLAELDTMTPGMVSAKCSQLECCLLVSDDTMSMSPTMDVADTRRMWKINLLDKKGQIDQNLVVDCDAKPTFTSKSLTSAHHFNTIRSIRKLTHTYNT